MNNGNSVFSIGSLTLKNLNNWSNKVSFKNKKFLLTFFFFLFFNDTYNWSRKKKKKCHFFMIKMFRLKNIIKLISFSAQGDTVTNWLILDHNEHGFLLYFSFAWHCKENKLLPRCPLILPLTHWLHLPLFYSDSGD